MYLKRLNEAARTVSFRLNFWYACILICSSAVLFFTAYGLLSLALERKDREVLEARLTEYAVIYQNSGLTELTRWLDGRPVLSRTSFFVRLMHP